MFGAEAGKSSAWGLVGLTRQLVMWRLRSRQDYYSHSTILVSSSNAIYLLSIIFALVPAGLVVAGNYEREMKVLGVVMRRI